MADRGSSPAAQAASQRAVTRVARYGGALALLAVGLDHIEQYYADSYAAIPTIGTLFALNFASATLVAVGLVAPIERLTGRWGNRLLALLALSGIGVAAGSLAGLLVSEGGSLFGFREIGYRAPIVMSIVLEVATVILLAAFLLATYRSRSKGRGTPIARPIR